MFSSKSLWFPWVNNDIVYVADRGLPSETGILISTSCDIGVFLNSVAFSKDKGFIGECVSLQSAEICASQFAHNEFGRRQQTLKGEVDFLIRLRASISCEGTCGSLLKSQAGEKCIVIIGNHACNCKHARLTDGMVADVTKLGDHLWRTLSHGFLCF